MKINTLEYIQDTLCRVTGFSKTYVLKDAFVLRLTLRGTVKDLATRAIWFIRRISSPHRAWQNISGEIGWFYTGEPREGNDNWGVIVEVYSSWRVRVVLLSFIASLRILGNIWGFTYIDCTQLGWARPARAVCWLGASSDPRAQLLPPAIRTPGPISP